VKAVSLTRPWPVRRMLAQLVSAEVRRLAGDLKAARQERSHARRVAIRWYLAAKGPRP
jgi:hypothetical protein